MRSHCVIVLLMVFSEPVTQYGCSAMCSRESWLHMRAVIVWMCPCGIRYKALTEINKRTEELSKVTCTSCRRDVDIEGKIIEVKAQTKDIWQAGQKL